MMNREEQVEKLTTYIAHFRISRGGDKPACKVHL